jgi:opacity protein-like surface antigen
MKRFFWLAASIVMTSSNALAESPNSEDAQLHRHRLAFSAQGIFGEQILQPSHVLGVGVTARYFFSERWGLKLDADFLRSVDVPQARADQLAGKGVIDAEFLIARASGAFAEDGFDFRSRFDLYVDAGIGAVWSRPISITDPEFRMFSYRPDLAFDVGVGTRMYLTPSVALTFGVAFTTYNAQQENTDRPVTDAERADQTTWFGASAIQDDLTASLGIEFLLPGARSRLRVR